MPWIINLYLTDKYWGIQWIEIHAVDNAIHLLNNWGRWLEVFLALEQSGPVH